MRTTIRIATRKSPLALWQANFVKQHLQQAHPEIEVELLGILTTADKMLATPLNKIGGKGLFVKELEKAMLEHQADIAVHSIKDMPTQLPDGLELAVILKREDPRDAFVSNAYSSLTDLPSGAVLGTSSLRRKAQALALRPDLTVKPLRGNIGTRLQKLDEEVFDAIILASAGLKRLGLSHRINSYFSVEEMIPAAGQGSIGIECRCADNPIYNLIAFLEDPATRYCVLAERAFNDRLGGSCQFPIAAFAEVSANTLTLKGFVSDSKGTTCLRIKQEGPIEQAMEIGRRAALEMINQGAEELLQQSLMSDRDDIN